MMSRCHACFLVVLLCSIVALTCAIYDPSETTSKPPKWREPVPPWHSPGKIDSSEDLSRSPKWQTEEDNPPSWKPQVTDTGTKSWNSWRRNRESELEQRTEIADTQSTISYDQQDGRSSELGQIEQQEELGVSRNPGASQMNDDKDEMQTAFKGNSQTQMTVDQDFYEGIPPDSTKSRKENILLPTHIRSTVARYDLKMGVQCPELDSTGQFVYPPDCRFFVNCWGGRAFVQPCAPGTLFNPDTLECDFPTKVKCYGGELADFPSNEHLDSSGRREPLLSGSHQGYIDNDRPQEPRCPPYITGMVEHPSDCTKFLQCANGATYVMDCGPGTVFNPAISVCDWPHNVKGCEDALKSKEEITTLFPNEFETFGQGSVQYADHQAPKRATCPPDFTGLLPHPDTCKKFLQCANGGTFVMDCGPGTAFNPSLLVCDWPYNVPGCSEENQPVVTTFRPWWSHSSGTWHHQHNHTSQGHYRPTIVPQYQPPTTVPPKTNWDPLRPTWIPSWTAIPWTTAMPPYSQGRHHTDTDYGSPDRQHEHKDHGLWGHRQWDRPTTPGYPQWPQNNPERQHHHLPHPHYHHHPHQGTYGSNKDTETQVAPPFGHPQVPGQGHETGTWHFNHGFHHSYHHHIAPEGQYPVPEHPWKGEESGQQTEQPAFDQNEANRGTSDGIGQGNLPNRQDHGRVGPGFSQPRPDQASPSNGNVGNVDHNRQFSEDQDSRFNTQTTQNWTSWTQPEPTGNTFTPGSRNQYGPGRDRPNNRQWDQGPANEDDKFREWGSRTNIYQSTADREADSKLNQWASKTNIFQHAKGKIMPGVKNNLSNSTNVYPNGIYVNVNGTKGHFITKDIDVRQGHSKTKIYRPNDLPRPNESDKPDQNIYVEFQTANIDKIPSMVLQPPPITSNSDSDDPNNTEDKNTPSGHGSRTPKNHWESSMDSGDLAESDTNYHRVRVPSPNLEPPYPSYDIPLVFPPITNFTRGDRYYPPKPSTNLEPPDYEPPRRNVPFPMGWQYPSIPSEAERLPNESPTRNPPNFASPSIDQPYGSRANSQPSSQLSPPEFTPNVASQYPNVPSSNLEPPYPESDSSNDPSYPVDSTIQRIPEKQVPPPPKKWGFEATKKPEDETITTTDPNVPSVWIEDDESPTTAFPDILEPTLEPEVDLLDDKMMWKPVLVYENKTQTTTTTESSAIMKINNKKVDVDLFKIEEAPLEKEEPPFPSYFVPPVEPISHSKKRPLPTPISGQVIRLRGGPGPHEGYVEVQGMNPGWGIVCDTRNSWSLKEAHVVCKQLGYARGAEMAWQGRNDRSGVPTWIAANSVSCQGNEDKFQSCKFTHEQECKVKRDAIGVRCQPNRVAHCRKDEVPFEGQCYHLGDPENATNHAEALEYCSQRQSRLIDITSQAENNFISEWLLQTKPEVTSIMTSGFGFNNMNRILWLWDDSSHARFSFSKWWPGWMEDKKQSPIVGSRPLCVVMKREFPCHERPDSICVADYFFWDAEDCATSSKGHSYVCKRPYDDIGCIYGKGNQYAGTANVTASGKDCLSWGDPDVAYPLAVNVANKEVREKLKTHNYCRNPNPNRESKPWCFTGPRAEREHCDIPPCGNIGTQRSIIRSQCKPNHFECSPGECIPSAWYCDGEEDCINGADERNCVSYMDLFRKYPKHKLEGYDVQKWLYTPLETCARRCKEADFTCRSFAHNAMVNICLLSDNNVGITGSLEPNAEFDYYEMKGRSINCEGMFVCQNRKCINQSLVCDGKNNCNDRSDEKICSVEQLDYDIRLAGSKNSHEGRIEVKHSGVWGQVCDDGFDMVDADVICKELGFELGAFEIKQAGYFGNMEPRTRFMVDQLKCRGNETSLRECDFDGWGVHDCQPEEAVGVVCRTEADNCLDSHWRCDVTPLCIITKLICDSVVDCADGSDEDPKYCDAPFEVRLVNGSSPLEGRVEVRHHGIWGTVCDDDFTNAAATVICRSLGYGGPAIAKKNGYFGAGKGIIWLDNVFCRGNETQLYRCKHNLWGENNCKHNEDAGVICTPGDVNDSKNREYVPPLLRKNINDILPTKCGKRFKDFDENEDLIFEKVVRGNIARKGSYPWQASIRVRDSSISSHWCGAVILSPLHVLTAAHCLEAYNKGDYFVRAGDYSTEIDEGTEVEADIEDYYIHEDFRKGHRMNNDIALVLLKKRGIPLGKDIMPICLPPENAEYSAGLNCTISGFGKTRPENPSYSKHLRYGWVPLLDQSVCRAEHVYGRGLISDVMFCAGYLDAGTDTCGGDSGGPLACLHNGAFTLYGLTSWGYQCGEANKPGVYVRVAHYRRWIDQKIIESLAGR